MHCAVFLEQGESVQKFLLGVRLSGRYHASATRDSAAFSFEVPTSFFLGAIFGSEGAFSL